MFLAEPPRTAYDWNFRFLSFLVRVTPFFFLMALLVGFQVAQFEAARNQQPVAAYLATFIGVCFLSILVHELGHSLMWRRFGQPSRIVLYHFGGLAIPDAGGWEGMRSSYGGPRARELSSRERILVSAAGPGATLLMAALILLLMSAFGYRPVTGIGFIDLRLPTAGRELAPGLLRATILHLQWINIMWALLNLLPIYPLDGGQISRELFLLYSRQDAIRNSLILSMVAALGIGVFALSRDDQYLGMMGLVLAFGSYQMLMQLQGGGVGRRW